MVHSPGFLKLVDEAKGRIRQTTPEEVKARIDAGEHPLMVDTREESEWKAGHIAGAVYIGRGVIERDIEAKVPDKDTEIILYCGGGFRSALAADNLQKMGYRNVMSMDGGWREWKKRGYPTE